MPPTTSELIGLLQNAASDCQQVIDNWESGHLASAVTGLSATKQALEDAAAQLKASLPFVAMHATPDGPTTANAFDDLDAAREWCQSMFDDPSDTPDGELPDEMGCIYQHGELVEQIMPGDAAQRKGWILATAMSAGPNGENVLEIHKHDEAGVFESDADALGHVMHLACREADLEARAAIQKVVSSWNDTG